MRSIRCAESFCEPILLLQPQPVECRMRYTRGPLSKQTHSILCKQYVNIRWSDPASQEYANVSVSPGLEAKLRDARFDQQNSDRVGPKRP